MIDMQEILNQAELSLTYFAGSGVLRPEEAVSWIDGLLNEALDESFPASDPMSSLKFD